MLLPAIRINVKPATINLLKLLPAILILLVLNPFSASAQKTGDFRSIATGKWSNKGAGPDSSQSVWAVYQAGYTSDWRIKSADSLGGDSINMRKPGYNATTWLKAVVPGTIYTSYVTDSLQTHEKNPDFGTNVDDALANTAYNDRFWYRLEFNIPPAYTGKHIWLNMGAVNRDAEIYVNNIRIGTIKGFRHRGMYDITSIVNTTGVNVLAIVIDTFNQNAINDQQQPTYMAGNGWDYTPSLPAYSRGITDRVFLSASGAVTIADPYLKTLSLDNNNTSATMELETRLTNHSDTTQNGTFTAIITPGNLRVSGIISLAPNQSINFNSGGFIMSNPKLWWPNGYGDPNLYHCNISYNINNKVSDSAGFNFGVRKFNYKNDKFGVLNIYVNGIRVFVRGGCWGMPEYMLRAHGSYDTRIRFHKEMGFNMIRAWCGTETDDEFYDDCDKYGIMLWDEFFQNGFFNGVADQASYMANVGEKVHRERNHSCIAIWCGMNEGYSFYDSMVEDSVKKYDEGQRLYQSTSNAGNTNDNTQFGLKYQGGISSDGPYSDLSLVSYFTKSPSGGVGINKANNYVGTYGFHPEWGAACFPSVESFRQFMPAADLWPRNNVWNYNHIFQDSNTTGGGGAGAGPADYMNQINTEFGTATGIEDFCRKAQLKNIEVHKALYEAFGDHMWNDASGLLMWMSNPSFTTMIWQTYDFYFDCTGAYWGIKKACEPVHIQWSIASDSVKIVNATNADANNLTAIFNVYNMDGTVAQGYSDTVAVNAKKDTTTFCFIGLNRANLAIHRPAVASSTNVATPGAVTDGNLGTRWSSNYTNNEWIYVDLGSPQTVGAVNLFWENAYGKSYEIQVSNDAQNWTTVYSTTTGNGGSDSISFTPVTARYVKMQGVQRGTNFGYSLYEFQVLAAEPAALSAVYFLKMKLMDSSGKLVSDNFYWYNSNTNYTTLATNMPVVPLQQSYSVTKLANGNEQVNLNLTNPANSPGIAFDVHVQLLQANGTRVLPVFMNDNYFSIVPGETKNVTIEFAPSLISGGTPSLLIQQYNSGTAAAAVKQANITSPDANLQLQLSVNNNKVYYQVNYKGKQVIAPSSLGITVNNTLINQVSAVNTITRSSVNQTYAWQGVHSTASNNYNEGLVTFSSAGNAQTFTLDTRVFNNGVAFCYLVPASGSNVVNSDSTSFSIPKGSITWSQGNVSYFEGTFTQQTIDAIRKGTTLGPPFTIKLPNNAGYAAITEGGNTNFAALSMLGAGNDVLNASLAGTTSTTGNIQTPWRIIEVGPDLNTLVNCDIIADVSPKPDSILFPQGSATSWLQAGQSLWSWISKPMGLPQNGVTYSNMLHYSHLASQMGIAYNLLDQGWEKNFPTANQTEWQVLKQLVDSAKLLNVRTWVWKPYSPQTNAFFPDPGLEDSTVRHTFFMQCAQAGVGGIKIDFFPGGQQPVQAWQQAALKDAAQLHLMLDFHGAIEPTGQERTWPNQMSREGIRGLEYQTNTSYPFHNTTIPFTRFLAGYADYTPFSLRQDVIAGTTLTHQVATLIAFTSPFMCMAVNPDSLLVSPVKNIVTSLPTTWDETRVLPPSEVGQLAIFARRKGTVWYLSVLNGPNTSNVNISLSFLGAGSYNTTILQDVPASVAQTAITNTIYKYTNGNTINVTLQPGGGLVAKFVQ